jgi:GTPase SAR1 family protein
MYPTVGEAFVPHTIQINNEDILLHIWDTAGYEKFAAQSAFCVRDAHCCIILYDGGTSEGQISYSIVTDLIRRYESTCILPDPFVVVAANKCDLLTTPDAQARELEKLEALEGNIRLKSFLVSAKTGEQVNELFNFVAATLVERARSRSPTLIGGASPVAFPAKEKGKRGCC